MNHNTQPYDSSLKALFEGHVAEIIPHLSPGTRLIGELNDEVLKPPVRADRVYIVDVYNAVAVVHIEIETGAGAEIAYRLLEYYGILLKKHQEPLISIVIYPFRTILPESPLRVKIGTFLKRTDTVEETDKRKLEIYMNQFESLLEENSLRGFAGDIYHSRGKLNFLLLCHFRTTRPLSGVFR